MKVTLEAWRPIGKAGFTSPDGLELPMPPAGPGLYRFILRARVGSVYVGETEDLPRRFRGYVSPGRSQRTNQRLRSRMAGVLSAGGVVEVEVCRGASVSVESCSEPLDLRVKSHRLLAEEAALSDVRREGFGTVENAGG